MLTYLKVIAAIHHTAYVSLNIIQPIGYMFQLSLNAYQTKLSLGREAGAQRSDRVASPSLGCFYFHNFDVNFQGFKGNMSFTLQS